MLHLNTFSAGGPSLTWWINSSQNNIIPCTGTTFPALATGTIYSIYMDINPAANYVHISGSLGVSLDCYSPYISQTAGNLTIWEVTDSTSTAYNSLWKSTEQDGSSIQQNYGQVNSSAGFNGSIGAVTPEEVFASGLSIGTTTTSNPVEVNNPSGQPGIRVESNTSGAVIDIKTTTGGYTPDLLLDEGETHPVALYSQGNANDFAVNVNNTQRMEMPSSINGVGTVFPNGNVGVGTSSAIGSNLVLQGNMQMTGLSSITTPSIGGAIVGLGCDTATSSIDSTVTSSTAAFVTTPQNFPGAGFFWQTYLSAPGVATTEVCTDVTATPTATPYVVKIIK